MKKDNKGFSLVELIVVVAIMAVLMTVLAPQLLRYVEQTRLQKDNTALSEVANAVEIAMANETINNLVTTTTPLKVCEISGNTEFKWPTGAETGANALTEEMALSIGSVKLSSTTYSTGTIVITAYKDSNGTITIKSTGWKESTTATATEHSF